MERKVNQKEVTVYALSNAAQSIGQIVPFTYVNMYMTDYLHISPAVAGAVLLVAKTIDFIVCLLSGVIMEKVSLPWGKYVSWFRVLPWVIASGCVIQMIDTTSFISSEIIRAVIVLVGYLCLHCCMSFMVTARSGIMQKMAGSDMAMRRTFTTRQVQFAAATTIISSAVTLPAIQFLQPYVGESGGYLVVTLIFNVFYLSMTMMFVKMASQYDRPEDNIKTTGKKAATIKEIFQSIAVNKQMQILVCIYTLFGIGTQLFSGLLVYYYKVVIDQFMMMAVISTIRSCVAFGASLVVPAIGKKLGKKMSLVVGMGTYALCVLGIWLFALKSIWILAFFLCLGQSAMYLYSGFGVNFYLDCGEYGYYETGKDFRTIAMAVMNVPTKIGFAIGGSAVSFGLAFIGYQADMVVTEQFTANFMRLIGLVPACLMLAAAAMAFLFYKLTDEQAEFYAKENEKREKGLA